MCEGVRIEGPGCDHEAVPCLEDRKPYLSYRPDSGLEPPDPPDVPRTRLSCDEFKACAYHESPAGYIKARRIPELTEKELGDLMRMVEGSTNLPAREAAKLGKIVDPAKRERKAGKLRTSGKAWRKKAVR